MNLLQPQGINVADILHVRIKYLAIQHNFRKGNAEREKKKRRRETIHIEV